MKVLHVVESIGGFAVESWLERMYLYGVGSGVDLDWTFYCQLPEKGRRARTLEGAGARVIPSPCGLRDKWTFARALRDELVKGRYDVLHMHHDIVNGFYVAASMGLPGIRRICHIHNSDENTQMAPSAASDLVRGILRRVALFGSDHVVGISQHTLDRFLNGRERRPPRDLVHYYGIQPGPPPGPTDERSTKRSELGLKEGEKVVLFAGRVVAEKNPLLAVEVFHALQARREDTRLVVAGDGGLLSDMKARVEELGLGPRVDFLGWRNDIPSLMEASDLFLLLRPEEPPEGLGIAVVEAQLAGLPMLLSRGIKPDALLPTAVYEQRSLRASKSDWATAADRLLTGLRPSVSEARRALSQSPFHMPTAFAALQDLHGGGFDD